MPPELDSTADVLYEVRRLRMDVKASYEDFRSRYERAVPVLDTQRFGALKEAHAEWDVVLAATEENAPHDFIIYWSSDVTDMMGLAGNHTRCVQYLMGNHTVAERMFRHDPAVMLYAPLRTAIYEDPQGGAWFCVDQPSTQFGSFGKLQIAQVGAELDRDLARLLETLAVPVPSSLSDLPKNTPGAR
jgi:hypothetical protein